MNYKTFENLQELQIDLNNFLSNQFEIENEIVPSSPIVDALQLDSLDLLDLVVSIEERYGVAISNDEMKAIETMDHLYSFLYNRQSNAKKT